MTHRVTSSLCSWSHRNTSVFRWWEAWGVGGLGGWGDDTPSDFSPQRPFLCPEVPPSTSYLAIVLQMFTKANQQVRKVNVYRIENPRMGHTLLVQNFTIEYTDTPSPSVPEQLTVVVQKRSTIASPTPSPTPWMLPEDCFLTEIISTQIN